MDAAKQYLIDNGIKPSVQRIAIMLYLLEHRSHPTVDEIFNDLHKAIPTLSKTTVYNTLKVFAEKGAILSLTIDEKMVRFDGYKQRHAHFKCISCNEIYDVELDHDVEFPNNETTKDFENIETHVYHRGYCAKCAKKKETNNKLKSE
ncbi:MAG: transcriptional repressor [Bacteroidales bacterium]|nr:transcriptional repressor [Bacteroidales bacterium]